MVAKVFGKRRYRCRIKPTGEIHADLDIGGKVHADRVSQGV